MNTRTFLKSLATIAVAPHVIPKAMCRTAVGHIWVLDPSYSGNSMPEIMRRCPHCMDLFAESHGFKKIILYERVS